MRGSSRQAGLSVFVVATSALLLQAACRDTPNAPASVPVVPDEQVHQVRWASSAPRQFAVTRTVRGEIVPVTPAASASASGELAFWAYTNRDVTFNLSVLGEDGTWEPYLRLVVPRGSLFRRPDGSGFDWQDSIRITVSPNAAALQVDLEPSGLVFNPLLPARLTMSYALADEDLNGDGTADGIDDYIRQVLIGLRTRQAPTDPWITLPSLNDVIGSQLSADIRHFTGYAVSW